MMGLTFPQRIRVLCGWALIVLCIAGCFGGRKVPRTYRANGKITYKDAPVAGAQVGFVSKLDNKDVLAAHGVTDDRGEFSLTTYIDPKHEVSGATPGDFVVTVTKTDKIDPKAVMANFGAGNPTMKGFFKQLIPAKYGDAKQSTLKATVVDNGKNEFDFVLVD